MRVADPQLIDEMPDVSSLSEQQAEVPHFVSLIVSLPNCPHVPELCTLLYGQLCPRVIVARRLACATDYLWTIVVGVDPPFRIPVPWHSALATRFQSGANLSRFARMGLRGVQRTLSGITVADYSTQYRAYLPGWYSLIMNRQCQAQSPAKFLEPPRTCLFTTGEPSAKAVGAQAAERTSWMTAWAIE